MVAELADYRAIELSTHPRHLRVAAEILKEGGVVAGPFNGVFGLFADVDNPEAADKIIEAKRRPADQNLIIVTSPEYISEVADLSKVMFPTDNLAAMWREIHGLGLILPAADNAPAHIAKQEKDCKTVCVIWTEYDPIKILLDEFRKLGGRALAGTSANIHGTKTHCNYQELRHDFFYTTDALIEASFDALEPRRRKSTSLVNMLGEMPVLHRRGNVMDEEIHAHFVRHNMPGLLVPNGVKTVKGREEENIAEQVRTTGLLLRPLSHSLRPVA